MNRIKKLANIQVPPGKSITEVKYIASTHELPIQYERKKVNEGWIDKSKSMLQILYDREFIDTTKDTNYYTVKGRKDENR